MIDLDEVVVHVLFDVLIDVLGLDAHCRLQLALCRCSCSLYDGLLGVDGDVETNLLHTMLRLDSSVLCLDAIHHDDVANAVGATPDVLLLGYPNDDAIRSDDDDDANLSNVAVLLLVLLPTHHPIPDVDAAIDVHLAANLDLLLHYRYDGIPDLML